MDKKLLFIQWLTDSGLSPQTIKDYSFMCKRFPEDLDQTDVDIYCNKNKRTIDRATIKNYIEFMIHKFPEQRDHYRDLRIPKPKGREKTKIADYPTEEELKKIVAELPSNKLKMMALIQFYSALRPQGIIGITADNFYLDEWLQDRSKACRIKIFESKTGERIVYLRKEVMELVYPRLNGAKSNAPLFNIQYRAWHHYLTTASKKALGRSISPHKLRHGGATWLLTKKGYTLYELSNFLGHKNITTTQIYAHLDKGQMEDKYSK